MFFAKDDVFYKLIAFYELIREPHIIVNNIV